MRGNKAVRMKGHIGDPRESSLSPTYKTHRTGNSGNWVRKGEGWSIKHVDLASFTQRQCSCVCARASCEWVCFSSLSGGEQQSSWGWSNGSFPFLKFESHCSPFTVLLGAASLGWEERSVLWNSMSRSWVKLEPWIYCLALRLEDICRRLYSFSP